MSPHRFVQGGSRRNSTTWYRCITLPLAQREQLQQRTVVEILAKHSPGNQMTAGSSCLEKRCPGLQSAWRALCLGGTRHTWTDPAEMKTLLPSLKRCFGRRRGTRTPLHVPVHIQQSPNYHSAAGRDTSSAYVTRHPKSMSPGGQIPSRTL